MAETKTHKTELRIERSFHASPETVFDAFTEPTAMRVWWTENTSFEIDLRVGSTWTITREENGTTYVMTGKYLEIDRPHRLKHTIAMPQFSPNEDVITIEIMAEGAGGSRMQFTQSGPDIASELGDLQEGAVSESEKGWQLGFDMMEEAWRKDSGEN